MMIGKGKIAFAHVEQVIDFPSKEGVMAYVEWNARRNRKVFYEAHDEGDRFYWIPHFDWSKCVRVTGERDNPQYTIYVRIPYNGINMGA